MFDGFCGCLCKRDDDDHIVMPHNMTETIWFIKSEESNEFNEIISKRRVDVSRQ